MVGRDVTGLFDGLAVVGFLDGKGVGDRLGLTVTGLFEGLAVVGFPVG